MGEKRDHGVQHWLRLLQEKSVAKDRESDVACAREKALCERQIAIAQQTIELGVRLEQQHWACDPRQNLFGIPIGMGGAIHGHPQAVGVGADGSARPGKQIVLGIPRDLVQVNHLSGAR